jgi:hypothetical protein
MLEVFKRQLQTTFYTYVPLLFKITLQVPVELSTQPYPVRRNR